MAKDSYFIECPFYKKDDRLNIRCEGTDENNRIITQFTVLVDKADYMERFCKNPTGYYMCKLFSMLDSKYDEQGQT